METSCVAGPDALEVAMNTEGAVRIVSRHRLSVLRSRLLGMGTARNLEEARSAAAAGTRAIAASAANSSTS